MSHSRTRFAIELAVMAMLALALLVPANFSLPFIGQAQAGANDTVGLQDTRTGSANPNQGGLARPDHNNAAGRTPQPPAPAPRNPAPDRGLECTLTDATSGMRTLTHNGIERRYHLSIPASNTGITRPLPVLISLHGYTGTINKQRAVTQLEQALTNTIIVTPKSSGDLWNSDGHAEMADDVAFLKTVLAEIDTELCIDSERIHIAGFSNGAAMASYAVCALDGIFATLVLVSGVNLHDGCESGTPLEVFVIHGEADNVVGFNGEGLATDWAIGESVHQATARWAAHNGCAGPAIKTDNGGNTIEVHANCAGDSTVTLVTVAEIGHSWMGSTWYVEEGFAAPVGIHNFDATNAIANIVSGGTAL